MSCSDKEDFADEYINNDFDSDNEYMYLKSTTNDEEDRLMKDDLKKGGVLFQKAHFYEVLKTDDLTDKIDSTIRDLMDKFGLTEGTAFQILHKKGWNENKAINSIMEEAEFSDFQITSNKENESEMSCPICFGIFEKKMELLWSAIMFSVRTVSLAI